ncbi:MAG: hypothetical protein JNL58_22770 [Planctomyces sp.]|nr:hypothetical protein [Planctomyces sp.]
MSRLFLLSAVSALMIAHHAPAAEEPGRSDPPSTGFSTESTSATKQRMLVLISGKIVTGRMTPRLDGYDVAVSAGRMFVASDQIRFEATDLEDAYIKMRESMTERSPEQHLELAKWCLTNKLEHRAKRELLDALHLDPNRTDAKRILQSLELSASNGSGPKSSGTGFTQFPSTSASAQPMRETRSLGGFSRDVAKSFVQEVQPILVNKCGNAACHGNQTSVFQLTSLRRGATPAVSEQNLAAVLKQIDLSQPAQSPILQVGQSSHGGSNVPLFRGRAGGIQQKVLRQWVLSAAAELNPDMVSEPTPVVARRSTQEKLKATPVSTSEDTTDTASGKLDETAHERIRSKQELDSQVLEEIQYLNRNDAFDPELFNSKYRQPASTSGQPTNQAADN